MGAPGDTAEVLLGGKVRMGAPMGAGRGWVEGGGGKGWEMEWG